MGIFRNLFGEKKLKITDSDFGEIESFSTKGDKVGWKINQNFLNSDMEILIDGDRDGVSNTQKGILLDALSNEPKIKSESEQALKEQFDNAEMEFVSIEKHFDVNSISVHDDGFELTFQEKDGQNYFFNVHFENNKQVGVSIDG